MNGEPLRPHKIREGGAQIPHAHAHRRNFRFLHHSQHPPIIVRAVRHGGDFDYVGIERRQPVVDGGQIFRRLTKVVVTDDAFRLAIAADGGRGVFFQIDVIHAVDDRGPQHHLPLVFGAAPFAAVGFAPNGNHYRARPLAQQPLQIHLPVDVVQPQFDQLRALSNQVTMLGDHVPMPPAADGNTNHEKRSPRRR